MMSRLTDFVNLKKKLKSTGNTERWQVRVSGVVQGVGFRPFILRTANRYELTGYVLNQTGEVLVEAQGDVQRLISFANDIWEKSPGPARINDLKIKKIKLWGDEDTFSIRASVEGNKNSVFPSPDIALCDSCKNELNSRSNDRYLHAFISCTNCGPRYTIQISGPYDRINTTMDNFKECEACKTEYNDVSDRRLHSQTNCCHHCGPSVSIYSFYHPELCVENLLQINMSKIREVCELLENDGIVMVKGIGGYHYACKATSALAVLRMRQLKQRPKKPLAVMVKDLLDANKLAEINPEERRLLASPASPIVVLTKRKDSNLTPLIAPGSNKVGVMLAYSPLHQLIFKYFKEPLVMTSANLKDRPIEYINTTARDELAKNIDCIIDHNRDIINPCDDSVVRVIDKQPVFMRRSRGYVPESVSLDFKSNPMLALGGDIKSTFALASGEKAFLGPFTGDLQSWHNFKRFTANIESLSALLKIKPEVVAHDMHPSYKSTELALSEYTDKTIAVQHHHAHVVSCMVEKQIKENVIGIAFDGSGWGLDETIWGGEFLICNREKFIRAAHLRTMPIPGGNKTIKNPYRMAAAVAQVVSDKKLSEKIIGILNLADHELSFIEKQICVGLNTPHTSSMGRLFDIVAAITGISRTTSYEGEAAVELEEAANPHFNGSYRFDITGKDLLELNYETLLSEIVDDISKGINASDISAKFHNAIALMLRDVCLLIRDRFALQKVVLAGGVFQNKLLLHKAVRLLKSQNFDAHYSNIAPINDNGIALGQIAIANAIIASKEKQQCV